MATNLPGAGAGNVASHLPWLQTRMALERTLLAWVRTAASLIGFGFAIFQFFELLNHSPGVAPPFKAGGPRILGLALVGIGTLALALALVQYLIIVKYLGGVASLQAAGLDRLPRFRPALIVAVTLTAVGIITLWALLARVPP